MTTDRNLFFCASLLIFLGVLMSYSLSTYTTVVLYHYGEFHFFIRQLVSAIIGIVIMWGLSRVDPSKWFSRLGFFLLFIFFGSCFSFYNFDMNGTIIGPKLAIFSFAGSQLSTFRHLL